MLLGDARVGGFQVVLAESLDPPSRDQEDIAHLDKRFGFEGIKIATLSEGEVNELHIGLKGTTGALYLKDLADRTGAGSAVVSRPASLAVAKPMATTSCAVDRNGEAVRGARQKPYPQPV